MDHLTANEFEEALQKRLVPALGGNAWQVCTGGYLIKGSGEERYLVPAFERNVGSKWRTINLAEEQDLVPDFVKAYRRGLERCKKQPPELGEFEEPILGFVRRYGLGIAGELRWYGGREETLRSYIEVMQYVDGLVNVLEALLSGEEDAVDAALGKSPDVRFFLTSPDDVDLYLENGGAPYRDDEGEVYEMGVVEHALTGLGYIVAHWFHNLCLPFAIPEPRATRLNQIDTGWGFSSLTGAIFWHLFQFLGAQSRITRCKYCGDLIPNARKNIQFCRNGGECRNKYDNHSGRRAERARRKSGDV